MFHGKILSFSVPVILVLSLIPSIYASYGGAPIITISPSFGSSFPTTVQVYGWGFDPNTTVQVLSSVGTSSHVRADTNGYFTTQLQITAPPAMQNSITITATEGSNTATTIFSDINPPTGTPTVIISPTSGPVGAPVIVTGSTFFPNGQVDISVLPCDPSVIPGNKPCVSSLAYSPTDRSTGWFSKQMLIPDQGNSPYFVNVFDEIYRISVTVPFTVTGGNTQTTNHQTTNNMVLNQQTCVKLLGGTWMANIFSTIGTCTIFGKSTIPSGSLQIKSNEALTVFGSLTIPNGVSVTNSGTINTNGGAVIESSGTITNSGTINNNGGLISNKGNLTNDATIYNYGNLITDIDYTNLESRNNGTITNSGTIANYGIINNGFFCTGQSNNGENNGGTTTGNINETTINGTTTYGLTAIKNQIIVQPFGTTPFKYNISPRYTIPLKGNAAYPIVGSYPIHGPYPNLTNFSNHIMCSITGSMIINDNIITNYNKGLINNDGGITNSNYIDNAGGTVRDAFGYDIANDGTIVNSGTISGVEGNFVNKKDGKLANIGTIFNNNTDVIDNFGDFENGVDGNIIIQGTITNDNGGFTNRGTIQNENGFINNWAAFTNVSHGKIQNRGLVYNEKGGGLVNWGFITNYQYLYNSDNITNTYQGKIVNYNDIYNSGGGTITNSGDISNNNSTNIIVNGGTITNSGNISNKDGSITNEGDASIINSGYIENSAGFNTGINNLGFIESTKGGALVNERQGTINNYGGNVTVDNNGILSNSGSIFSNGLIYDSINGDITNIGTISNNDGSTFLINEGTLINGLPSPFTASGSISYNRNSIWIIWGEVINYNTGTILFNSVTNGVTPPPSFDLNYKRSYLVNFGTLNIAAGFSGTPVAFINANGGTINISNGGEGIINGGGVGNGLAGWINCGTINVDGTFNVFGILQDASKVIVNSDGTLNAIAPNGWSGAIFYFNGQSIQNNGGTLNLPYGTTTSQPDTGPYDCSFAVTNFLQSAQK